MYNGLLGYDMVDGKIVANETETKIVTMVYEKYKEYIENPPQGLVEEYYHSNRERYGEEYTWEDAKKAASLDPIIYTKIWEDVCVVYGDYLKKIADIQGESVICGVLSADKNNQREKCKSNDTIIDEDAWQKAQEITSQKMGCVEEDK